MNAIINGRNITFSAGETVLAAARRNGFFIPSLCASAPLGHAPGTCRVCLVECVLPSGERRIAAACATPLEEGMIVCADSPEVRARQRLQTELLLADHDLACDACPRRGRCELQDLAAFVGLSGSRFRAVGMDRPRARDESAPAFVMDPAKCVRCLRCAEVCRRQGIGVLAPEGEGLEARMGFIGAEKWGDSGCVGCGQCALVCPVGAIALKSDSRVPEWLADPSLATVVHFPAAVGVLIGKAFGLDAGTDAGTRLAAAFRLLGADLVCDAGRAADMAAAGEAAELRHRLRCSGVLPLFSSRCPAWIRYAETRRPELGPHLSEVPSPQIFFDRIVRNKAAQRLDSAADKLRLIAVTPCTAGGHAPGPEGVPDATMTVRQCADLLRCRGIHLSELEPEPFDDLYEASMGGEVSGGTVEADGQALSGIRAEAVPAGTEGTMREASLILASGERVRAGICEGFRDITAVLDQALDGSSPYDFIEVTACPGGCVGGGGACPARNVHPPVATLRGQAPRAPSDGGEAEPAGKAGAGGSRCSRF